MKKLILCFSFLSLMLFISACASGPSDREVENANKLSANEAAPPKAETSPVEIEKLSEANYQQIALEIHRGVNEFRKLEGLEPLELHPIISEQAREHSIEMSETPDKISHSGFNDRIEDIKKEIPFRSAAENVAFNKNYDNPGAQVVEGWKSSPTHRKNMLGDFNQTGIGVAQGENGKYFFTQFFWKS